MTPAAKNNFVYPPRAATPKHCLRRRHHQMSAPLLFGYCAILLILLCQHLPITLAILFQEDDHSAAGTRCFCDKKNCGGGTLVCAGRFCLIGVRNEDAADGQGRLDQHCLEEDGALPQGKGCARDWRQWSEVCICEENLCNTWAFLRAQMDSPISVGANFRHHSLKVGAPAERSVHNALAPAHLAAEGQRQWGRAPYSDEDDDDADPPLARETDPLGFGRPDDAVRQRRGPALVLLLVVLPLVVGAFTVVLVFLNYHCNML